MRLTKQSIANSLEPAKNQATPQPTFGADDLITALSSLATPQQVTDGLSTQDWQAVTGWPLSRVNKTLRALHRAGRLRRGQIQREAIDGSMRWVSAYAIVPK